MFSFILLATGATIVMIDTKVFCNMPQNSKVEVSNKMIIVISTVDSWFQTFLEKFHIKQSALNIPVSQYLSPYEVPAVSIWNIKIWK